MKNSNSSNYDIIIPFKDLRKVTNECSRHIQSLLKTATHLHNNRDYPNSIFITIIAFEELGKLSTLSDYYHNQEGVPRKEMKKLTEHNYKLKKLIEKYESSTINLSESEFQKLQNKAKMHLGPKKKSVEKFKKDSEKMKKFFSSLNFIKQCCLYYDSREGNSLTLKHQLPKHYLSHLSVYLLEYVMYFLHYEYILNKYYEEVFFEIPKENNNMYDDPAWKACAEFAKKIESKKYQRISSNAWQAVDVINALYEQLKKRNLLIK